ncbi:MAG: glycogen/starch/alpha-glucan phosphorylase, partial [Reinekea sp.]|nr:glycogen/starch/alpha-glucan phosphorylase [Reinekea sp.]
VDDVVALEKKGYNPGDFYRGNDELKAVLDWLDGDFFTPGEPGLLSEVKRNLVESDPFMVLPDFEAYSEAHKRIDALYRDEKAWARAAIINTASLAKFNSDRSIADYADYIWHMKGVPAAAK